VRPRVRVGDLELAYDVCGDAGAPPMVLLHGLGEQAAGWGAQLPRFAERFRVVAFDLRGHGDSSRTSEYSHRLMAEDVCAALDALGLARVVLVGHSLGGAVGYHVAAVRPDLVSLLVAEDVCPPYPRNRPVPEPPDGVVPFDWAVVPAIIREVNAGSDSAWAELATIDAPTLLVAGGATSTIPQEKVAEVAERIPDCTLVTIPAGHFVHRDAPQQFTEVVLGWLEERQLP
jgi:pimeloyl-ACP methyl ester carboxylesterase